jgi:serine/threonine protein kinase
VSRAALAGLTSSVLFCAALCCALWLCCPAGNKLCIVMEFAPAGDLSSFLKAAAASKLPLPEATVWQIFLQLCQGMQVCRGVQGGGERE